MKRFYKQVEYKPSKSRDGFFDILLDGKPIKTPSQNDMHVPSEVLAKHIAKEWDCVSGDITQDDLPLTQLLNTAHEYVPEKREAIEAETIKYLETDLLVYHTSEPPEIAELQGKEWGRILKMFAENTDIYFEIKKDFSVTALSEKDFGTAKNFISELDDYGFTVFQCAVSATGSFILGFSLIKKHLKASEIFALCQLEEDFYLNLYDLEQHGDDPIQKKKSDALKKDLENLEIFWNLFS